MRRRRLFIAALWVAFVFRGAFHAVVAPMWDGFDEPGHLAYILFIDEHGRPPGFHELSFPGFFVEANRFLPSFVGHGAPNFAQWRAMPRAERDRSRAMADQLARNPDRYRIYISGNYERQQGPLFYYLAAVPGFVLRRLTLPKLLVAMRLFCVLLASTAVPIAARLFRLLGGDRALAVGLPLFALAPNTAFAFDRVSNETLAFPLATAIAVELVLVTIRPRQKDFLLLGALTAAGIFTRITFLAVLPAIVIALFLSRRKTTSAIAQAIGIPTLATAALLIWNKVGSGHISGIVEQSSSSPVTAADIGGAIRLLRSIPLTSEFARNHLWVGGWGFVKPPSGFYTAALLLLAAGLIAAIVAIALRGWRGRDPKRIYALGVVLVAFFGALAAHLFVGAIAAVRVPGSVTVGPGGWYLDEIRAMEVGIVAFFLAGATTLGGARRVGQLLIIACAACDAAGTMFLLLPRWAGFAGHFFSTSVYFQAIEAAPVRRVAILPLLLAAGWLIAIVSSLQLLQGSRRHAIGGLDSTG
jgi:hypothetical protein